MSSTDERHATETVTTTEWGVRAVWDDGEVAEGPLSEPPNTEEAAREVCKTLIDEWAPQVRWAEVVSRKVGPWATATSHTTEERETALAAEYAKNHPKTNEEQA